MTAPREEVTDAVFRLSIQSSADARDVCEYLYALRARLAAAEEAHAAMRDECSALRFDLRAALGERDEAIVAAAEAYTHEVEHGTGIATVFKALVEMRDAVRAKRER